MKSAILTIVHNEKIFLPIWIDYYLKNFEADDIYILSHNNKMKDLKCATEKGISIIEVGNNEIYNHEWLLETVKHFQEILLKKYDYVVYADADEIILPNPQKYKDLREYISLMKTSSVKCVGYDIVQNDESEFDTDKKVLEQRSWWVGNNDFSKSLIFNEPAKWNIGFHECENGGELDKDLFLLHLHKIDFELVNKKVLENKKEKFCEEDVKARRAMQAFMSRNELHGWFYDHKHDFVKIPDYIKESGAV